VEETFLTMNHFFTTLLRGATIVALTSGNGAREAQAVLAVPLVKATMVAPLSRVVKK
jgi:hypothetical protein